jgi:hypothetical protein
MGLLLRPRIGEKDVHTMGTLHGAAHGAQEAAVLPYFWRLQWRSQAPSGAKWQRD